MSLDRRILHRVDGPFFIITLNCPETLNAMSYDDFLYCTKLLDKADSDPNIVFTILQSTGKYFSSGADFNKVPTEVEGDQLKIWLENFVCKNQYITNTFINHKKILIACLNGPVIGLCAAIVLLCDIVYCINLSEKMYMQFPFSKLGLLCEGASSMTLPMKLGRNMATSKLLFSERIDSDQLRDKIVVKDYMMDMERDVAKFNDKVIEDLKQKVRILYLPSCLKMKQLLKQDSISQQLESSNAKEVHMALPLWRRGEPQLRFRMLRESKKRQGKL